MLQNTSKCQKSSKTSLTNTTLNFKVKSTTSYISRHATRFLKALHSKTWTSKIFSFSTMTSWPWHLESTHNTLILHKIENTETPKILNFTETPKCIKIVESNSIPKWSKEIIIIRISLCRLVRRPQTELFPNIQSFWSRFIRIIGLRVIKSIKWLGEWRHLFRDTVQVLKQSHCRFVQQWHLTIDFRQKFF